MRKIFIGMMLCLPLLVRSTVTPADELTTTLYCYDTDKLFKELRTEYQEMPLIMGEASDVAESTMSVWVSKNGQTWTIVATKGKLSCIVGAGKNLRIISRGKQV